MEIIKNLVSKDKYNIKCPYTMNATRIVVHNTANDTTARNEIKYMVSNNYQISYHFAIDDIEVVQGLPLDRNGWHAGDGNGKGNREGIGIEICYSKSGGDKFIKAEKNASKFIAQLLKERGWGIDRVTKHQDYSNKYCPHRTLDMGWTRFLEMVKSELDAITPATPKNIDVKYQVYAGGKWWSDITNYNNVNSNGYAGAIGQAISGLRANTVGTISHAGQLQYRVHTKGGKWLGWITDRNKDQWGDDFAGILNKPIDGVQIKSTKGTPVYRVHLKGGNWLSWIDRVDDTANGYAGIYGREIDAIQIYIK